MTKSHHLAHGVGSFASSAWSELDPVREGATPLERLKHRIKAHKHKITFHEEWAASHAEAIPEMRRGIAAGNYPKHWLEQRQKEYAQHTKDAERERVHLARNQAKLDELRSRPHAVKIASAVPRLAKEHNRAAREHAKYAPGGAGYLAAKRHYDTLARGPAVAPQTIRQRMGPETTKTPDKTNTGRKNADGRTIWRGPRGGMFVMKNGRKVSV